MSKLSRAIFEAVKHLETRHVPYMVFGGLATLQWGRSRLTDDVDIKVDVDAARWPEFVEELSAGFSVLPPQPLEFARSTYVVPIETTEGVLIDLVLASLPYEREAIARAVPIRMEEVLVRFCTAEDLILHKILSDRPRDREDIEGVVTRQGVGLDRNYLDRRVQMFARDLERPDILQYYEELLRKGGLNRS